MKQSFKLAYSGIVCGLSLAIMFFSAVFPFAEYTIPALSGILLIAVVVDIGFKQAVLGYIVVSVISALIVPNKQAVILFITFFGFYPILKGKFEMLGNKLKEWIAKLITFNICVVFGYYLLVSVTGTENILKSFSNITLILIGGLFILNITFIIYDIAVSRIISIYILKIRKMITKK